MIRENIESYLDSITSDNKQVITALEVNLRNDGTMTACVEIVNFPCLKTLDDFDFSYKPSINKEQIFSWKRRCKKNTFSYYCWHGIH